MLSRSTSTASVMIGIIATRWRGSETLPTVYWNSSPTFAAEATEATEAAASIGAAAASRRLAAPAPLCRRRRPAPPRRPSAVGSAASPPRRRRCRRRGGAPIRRSAVERLDCPASPRPSPPSYVCGRRLAYSSGCTTGRGTYSGWYRSWMKLIGRPLTSDSCTSFQSLSVWFSTIAQPWSLPGRARPAGVAGLAASGLRVRLPGGRRRRVRQDQPVARLPDRRLDDVPDPHPPLALPGEVDRHRLLVLVARLRQRGQRLVQLVLQLRVVAARPRCTWSSSTARMVRRRRAGSAPRRRRLRLVPAADRLLLLLQAEDRPLDLLARQRARFTFAPRSWLSSSPSDGLAVMSTWKLRSVLAIGSWLG